MAKTIYYKNPDTKKVQSFLVDDIDAFDAVRRFPNDYSFDAPVDLSKVEEVKTALSAMASGDNIPMGTDLQSDPAPIASK